MQNSSKSRLIITGANGFIGSFLIDFFMNRDFQVNALVHSMPKLPKPDVNYYLYDLNGVIPEEAFLNADYLIHCAYSKADNDPDAMKTNLNGTLKLIEKSRQFKLKKNIFLSSFSSINDAKSEYGKSKFETEKVFNFENDLVLKPGLVVGHGGLFQNIASVIKNSSVIPLIDGGTQLVQTLYIEDLALAIEKGISNNISGLFPLAEMTPITMKQMYLYICKMENKNPWIVSIPYFVALSGISFFTFFGLKTPVSKESLLGLRMMRTYDTSESSKVFGMNFLTFEETLKKI